MPAPRALVILGMHRSGTSALARLLHTLGVDFGTGHIPAGPANELGFFEKASVADTNERLLQALGLQSGSDPGRLPGDWQQHPAVASLRDDLVEQLRRDFFAADSVEAGVPLFGVKDPRICRLVPLWIDVLSSLGCAPAFVHITRHPLEVVDSLAARQALSAHTAQLLWLRHVLEGERATRGHPRVFVTYDELLAGWRPCAQRIAQTLDLDWPVAPEALAEADAPTLPGRLRHHHRAEDALSEEGGVSRWVGTAYRALLERRDGTEPGPTRRLDDIRRNLDAAEDLLAGEVAPVRPVDEAPAPLRYAGRLRWDQGQLDARATLGEILPGSVVEVSFVAGHGSFCGFDLFFGTFARTNTSTLDVALEVEDVSGELALAQRWSLPTGEIENDRWRAFRCPPQPESRGRRCRVRVETTDAAPGDAVTLYCDPEGRPAYRAYFVELSAPEDAAVAEASVRALEGRAVRLEEEALARDARIDALVAQVDRLSAEGRALPQVIDWSGRVPGIEERVGQLELRAAPEAIASVQARLELLEPRLESDAAATRTALDDLRREFENARSEGQRLREEVAEQRGRIEPLIEGLGEQIRVLRELHSATHELAVEARRSQQARLDELEGSLASGLEALRREDDGLREALAELGRSADDARQRVTGVERAQAEEARGQRAAAERLDRLESLVSAAAERIDALHRRTDRDLAAIGEALEEAWG